MKEEKLCFYIETNISQPYTILWKIKNNGHSTKVIDRIFGFIFGTIKGALCIALIFAVLSFFNESGLLKALYNYIFASPIGNFVYQNVNYFMDTYVNLKDLFQSIISIFK